MIGHLGALVGDRRPLTRYLTASAIYAVSEGVALGLLVPLLIALFEHRTGAATWWLVPLGATAIIGWIAQYQLGLRALGLSATWRRGLYARLGDHLLRLPLGRFDGPQAGQIPQVITADVSRVANTVFLAPVLLGAVLTPMTSGVFLLAFDWRVGLAALIAVPVVVLALTTGRRFAERSDAAQHAAATEAGARLVEFAQAQPALRAAGHSGTGRRTLDAALADQHRAARREVFDSLPAQHLGQLSIQLAFTGLLVTGLALTTHHQLDPVRMIALAVLGISLLRPLQALTGATTALRAGQASADRIAALLAVKPLPEPADPHHVASGDVQLTDVRFGYPGSPTVLDGATLTIPAGRTTALVGPSGAGKTTITKLIARFHDVQSGSVHVGGVDVRRLATAELLDTVSVVFQDVFLLDVSIEENIRFGRPDATLEQVRDAARRARVDSIVTRLPDGWASRVGEGGRLLSGGERQRVAIARALCKDSPIVLLDEATSSLDPENEAAVQAAIAELGSGRTVLVIAHRLSTITYADQIAVLDAGRIVEVGHHHVLLDANGRYASFWRQRTHGQGWRLASRDR